LTGSVYSLESFIVVVVEERGGDGEACVSAQDALVWSGGVEGLVGVYKRVRVPSGHDRAAGRLHTAATRSQ